MVGKLLVFMGHMITYLHARQCRQFDCRVGAFWRVIEIKVTGNHREEGSSIWIIQRSWNLM